MTFLLDKQKSNNLNLSIMECPKCKNKQVVKNGYVQGEQRYKCKKCSFQFIYELKQPQLSIPEIRSILHLYLEGLGQREIGKLINLPHTTIHYQINKFSFNKKLDQIRNKNAVRINRVELYQILKTNLLNRNEGKILLIDYSIGSSWINK